MLEPEPLVLWGSPLCRSGRVQWALEELQLKYTLHPILPRGPEATSEAFLALNRRGKIPVLQHGEFVLCESVAIGNYLADNFGRAPLEGPHTQMLAPSPNTKARALYDQWCFYLAIELDAQGLYIERKHVQLAAVYGEAAQAVRAAHEYFNKHLAVVAEELERTEQAGGYWLLHHSTGFGFSFADILLTDCLEWAGRIGWLPDSPVLQRYLTRATARPAFLKVKAVKQAQLSGLQKLKSKL